MKPLGYDLVALTAKSLRIPHWTQGPEAAELYRLGGVAPGPIVEVGTYCGFGSALLAAAGKQPVTTIDPCTAGWDLPYGNRVGAGRSIDVARELWERLGLTGRITWLEMTDEAAQEVAPAEIGLLFLDADHASESLRHQLDWYGPRIMPGGYLVLHDWGVPEPNPALPPWDVAGVSLEWTAAAGDWSKPAVTCTLGVYRRAKGT